MLTSSKCLKHKGTCKLWIQSSVFFSPEIPIRHLHHLQEDLYLEQWCSKQNWSAQFWSFVPWRRKRKGSTYKLLGLIWGSSNRNLYRNCRRVSGTFGDLQRLSLIQLRFTNDLSDVYQFCELWNWARWAPLPDNWHWPLSCNRTHLLGSLRLPIKICTTVAFFFLYWFYAIELLNHHLRFFFVAHSESTHFLFTENWVARFVQNNKNKAVLKGSNLKTLLGTVLVKLAVSSWPVTSTS